MATLIALLISLLGYGTPSDFSNLTEAELNHEIVLAENSVTSSENTDGGVLGGWDSE